MAAPSSSSPPAPPTRVLIARFSSLGDLVTISRVPHTLRRIWPEVEIDFFTSPLGFELYGDGDLFNGIYIWRNEWHGRLATISALRHRRYDLFLDLHCKRLTHFLEPFLRAQRTGRIGHGFFSRMFLPKRPPRPLHEMLRQAGIYVQESHQQDSDVQAPRLIVTDAQREAMISRLRSSGWRDHQPLFVLAPGSSPRWPSKRWPAERFRELAGRLAADGAFIVVVGSADERLLAEAVRGGNARVCNLAGETRLGETLALCSLAHAAVTNDSGPMHLAAGVGTPVLTLFGPTDPARHGPDVCYGSAHRSFSAHVPCSPCYRGHCPLRGEEHHRCMTALTVEGEAGVLAELEAMLPH